MSKLFIMGMSPLPFENDTKVYGPGIRTWQFAQPLLEQGHKICLVNYGIPSAYDQDFKSIHNQNFSIGGNEFDYRILNPQDFENRDLVEKIYNDFGPDCLIGATFYPSYIASKLKADQPFWADLFGHVMAEAQARAAVDDDDSCLFHYWNSEYNIIRRADAFSCVSARQEYALAGELGAAGRLNRHTLGYRFSTTIPCGMPSRNYTSTRKVIRNKENISEGDFVVLWTGGYNTWTDVETLFEGLEAAMDLDPAIKFVSTGAEIPEQDLKTYPHFLSLIQKSRHRQNYIMEGWVKGEDVPNYYLEADIGINIDKDIYEVRLGSKNRILDWMRAGLCVLSSNVCELTQIIEDEGIGYTFRPHDSRGLAAKLVRLAANRDEVKAAGKRGQEYGIKNFNFAKTTEKLGQWAASPTHAPDWGGEPVIFFLKEEALANLEKIAGNQKKMIKDRDERIAQLKAMLEKSFVHKLYAYLKAIKRKLKG